MKPFLVLLMGMAVTATVALILWAAIRKPGSRRRDYRHLERERNLLATAVQAIEIKADQYRDLDSVLAMDVRTIVRQLNTDRMDLTR